MQKRNIAIGFLGSTLDAAAFSTRWERWRPTVALCQHEDLLIHRFEILADRRLKSLLQGVTDDIRHVSPETEIRSHQISFSDPWDFEEVYEGLYQFARGYNFNTEEETYLLHMTTGTHVAQICLFLLAESRYIPGKLIQLSPPKRHDKQSPGQYRIIDLDLSRYDRIATRHAQEQEESRSFLKSGIETNNATFNRMIDNIERVAIHSRAPMLFMGPTGAGKSHIAKRIHALKKARRQVQGNFIELNCATLRGDAAMSALFGHVKGAFTGAIKDREGLLRAADGGILFLDEIGELGADEQAMLLRALEDKRFLPVGSDSEVTSDFQLIAGTNRDLWRDAEEGRFRDDLLARINMWTFILPGLSERPEDIEPNLNYELEQFAQHNNTLITFNREARERFLAFATSHEATWRANFRDLNAAVTRMATLAPGGRINEDIVEEEMSRLRKAWQRSSTETTSDTLIDELCTPEVNATLDLFDRVQLAEVLRVCKRTPSLSEAGRVLFSVSRNKKKNANDADRLRKYLAKFGLTWEGVKGK